MLNNAALLWEVWNWRDPGLNPVVLTSQNCYEGVSFSGLDNLSTNCVVLMILCLRVVKIMFMLLRLMLNEYIQRKLYSCAWHVMFAG